uniref:EGF-like domain-containing protein n=1 Tax=Labrus bergylta TaxID=56723 RepID=A0A3Q3F2N1_9LABR
MKFGSLFHHRGATEAKSLVRVVKVGSDKRRAACDPNPCRNGGTCEENLKGFTCLCPEGFRGLTCDSRLDLNCMSYACQEEQICAAGDLSRLCQH